MSQLHSTYRPYLGFAHGPVLSLLNLFRLRRTAEKWTRVSHPDPAWPLRGVLERHRMVFSSVHDRQYIALDYEPQVRDAILATVKPGFVCADVGAHIGYMTLLMAKCVGREGKVFSFEAMPENAERLRKNVELNGYLDRVEVINKAVSGLDVTQVEINLGPTSFESSLVLHTEGESVSLPAVALDDYFADKESLDFLKMDIEGAEALAFPAMNDVLRRLKPIILLEIHDGGWSSIQELETAGYELRDLEQSLITPTELRARRLNHVLAFPPRVEE